MRNSHQLSQKEKMINLIKLNFSFLSIVTKRKNDEHHQTEFQLQQQWGRKTKVQRKKYTKNPRDKVDIPSVQL